MLGLDVGGAFAAPAADGLGAIVAVDALAVDGRCPPAVALLAIVAEVGVDARVAAAVAGASLPGRLLRRPHAAGGRTNCGGLVRVGGISVEIVVVEVVHGGANSGSSENEVKL